VDAFVARFCSALMEKAILRTCLYEAYDADRKDFIENKLWRTMTGAAKSGNWKR
jgi:hypothetical protein